MEQEYQTPKDVAKRLKVSHKTVYGWIYTGKLRAIKAGAAVRIPLGAVEDFLRPAVAGDIDPRAVGQEK